MIIIQLKLNDGTVKTWDVKDTRFRAFTGESIIVETETDDVKIFNWVSKGVKNCTVEYADIENKKYLLTFSAKVLEVTSVLRAESSRFERSDTIYQIGKMNPDVEDLVNYMFGTPSGPFTRMIEKYI